MLPKKADDSTPCLRDSHKGAEAAAERGSQAADTAGGPLNIQSSPRGSKSTLLPPGNCQHVPLLSPRQVAKTCSDETPANAVGTPHVLPVIREDEEDDSKQRFMDACCTNAEFPVLPPKGSAGSEDGEAVLVAVRDFANYLHRELVQLHSRMDFANRRVGEVCAELRLEMASLRRQEAREREDLAASINEELERQRLEFQQEERLHRLNSLGVVPASLERLAESSSLVREARTALPDTSAGSSPARTAKPFLIADVDGGFSNIADADGGGTARPKKARSLTLPIAKAGPLTLPAGGVDGPFHHQECRDDEGEAGAVAAADALSRVRRLLRSSSENGKSNVARAVQRLEGDKLFAPPAVWTPRQRRNSLPVIPASTDVASKVEVPRTVSAAPMSRASPRTLGRSLLTKPCSSADAGSARMSVAATVPLNGGTARAPVAPTPSWHRSAGHRTSERGTR